MKKTASFFLLCTVGLLFTSACRTVKIDGPAEVSAAPISALRKAKQSWSAPSLSATELPPVLGGLVQSDNWVIYKDKQQEEFTGNVSYDNDAYRFRAQYALSDRARHTFTAKGQVYLRQKNPNGTVYEAWADRGQYNYQTQYGTLTAGGKQPVRLIYQDEKGQTLTATAQKATFDLKQKIYILEKNVRLERPSPLGMQTVTAQKVTLRQADEQALIEGDAVLTDEKRALQADTIFYDKANNLVQAYGARPLADGTTEEGTFAVIADNIQSDQDGQRIELNGRVQGWLVSPRINNSNLNTKF